jgi:flagellar basal-body rod protein FlgC
MLFRAMETSTSALTAERLRMDLIANNLANLNTTRGPNGEPYRRRYAVVEERRDSFRNVLAREMEKQDGPDLGAGVRVTSILEDQSPFKLKYDPSHPDADANGFVRLPNVDLVTELTDLIVAQRVYEANISAFNAAKAMALKALEIGR